MYVLPEVSPYKKIKKTSWDRIIFTVRTNISDNATFILKWDPVPFSTDIGK